MNQQNIELHTQEWYQKVYSQKGANRNSLRHNKGVLFQLLATEASIVRAAYTINHAPADASVLDVGCGSGADIWQLLRLGYIPKNIVGIDIQADRLGDAKKLYPQIDFIHGDASHMAYMDSTFDLVFESTMFATLPDDVLCAGIAKEMVRVCKPGGYLMLVDWRTPKPYDTAYKALTKRRLAALFATGVHTRICTVVHGALVPPLGRSLSIWLPSAYFVLSAVFPFLVGQVVYLLQKNGQGNNP